MRSEPLRRRLEQLGNCSTYGFAGFFWHAYASYRSRQRYVTRSLPSALKAKQRSC
ncbi:MAG: DUF2309 family protein [Candidatus Obscuribacter sp.]|nr:DUF2309 family protein [Candidatus Obscuribacter sp.]